MAEQKHAQATKDEPYSINIDDTLLMDLIVKCWPHSPTKRIQKWSNVLNGQDLVYIIDLLDLPLTALTTKERYFSTKLYGTLYDIMTRLSVIKVQINEKSSFEGNITTYFDKLEGYYVDCGEIINEKRCFMRVPGRGNYLDGQYVFGVNTSNKWSFMTVGGFQQKHYGWIVSAETVQSQQPNFDVLSWVYWNSVQKKHMPSVKLTVNSWNK